MFTENEFTRIKKAFDLAQKKRKQKLMKIWGVLLFLSIAIVLTLSLTIPLDFDDENVAIMLPIYGGLAIAITLTGLLISMTFQSEKPFFEYLYDEVFQKINIAEGLFLKYEAYLKVKDKFHLSGGLFTSGASIADYRHVSGMSNNNHPFDLYDCKMVTSSGKSSQTHFDGVYIVIDKQVDSDIQIRSNGSPRLKGVKYQRLPEYTDFRVYKQIDQHLNTLDNIFISFYKTLYQNTTLKHVYMSVVDNEIHLGIWFRKHPARKLKTVTQTSLNRVAEYFMKEFELVNQVAELDTY